MLKKKRAISLFVSLLAVGSLVACQGMQMPKPRQVARAAQAANKQGAQHHQIATTKTYGPQTSQEVLQQILLPNDILLLPQNRQGPFPLVVFLHGCGGLAPNHVDWGNWWRARGFAVYAINSYKGRGWKGPQIKEVCTGRRLTGTERTADAMVGLADVKTNPNIDPNRIIIMGWSHGGWTALDLMALNPPKRNPPTLTQPVRMKSGQPATLQGVRGVITLYPYCGQLAEVQKLGLNVRIPLLMLNGGADRIVPHEACEAVAARASQSGFPIRAHTYEGADHGFDNKKAKGTFRADVRADTEKRITAFLASVGLQ